MTRSHVFVVLGFAFLTLAAAEILGGGCACSPHVHWNVGDWGTSSVDGVELPFKTTLKFSSPEKPTKFTLSLASASIVVEGDPTVTGVEAEFEVKERTHGDASLVAAPDSIEVRSATGNPVLVLSAKIRVPPSTSVTVSTELGSVTVDGIADAAEVSGTSNAGRIELRHLRNVRSVTGRTSLGSVEVSAVGVCESLTCETEMGSVRASDVRTGTGRLKSSMGEVRAENSTFDHLYAHTEMGSVRLIGCTYKTKDIGTDLGSVKEE